MSGEDGKGNRDTQVQMLTTLHYVLQTQRMGTISESTGRASMFLTSVSMALVALGFIAQATELSAAFFAFAFALIAVLLLIGLSTFLRLVQLGAEDGALAIANEKIKQFYAAEPGVERWFAIPLARGGNIGERAVTVRSRFQLLMTASSMVAAINAALAGVAAALAASRSGQELEAAAAIGVALFAIAFAAQLLLSKRIWNDVDARMADRSTNAQADDTPKHSNNPSPPP